MTDKIPQVTKDDHIIETSTTHKKARSKSMVIFGLVLVFITVVAVLYWFFVLRGEESTDDAYVNGNQMVISSQVAGAVSEIYAGNMDYVHQGDVLLVLNAKDRQLALNQAEDNLAQAVRKIQNLKYSIQQLEAAVAAKQISVNQTHTDYMRQVHLAKTNSTTPVFLSHAKDAYDAALASLKMTQNQLKANQALLLDTPLRQQPAVKMAIDNVRAAWLNLQRTKVLSPVNGYVAKRNVQVGENIGAGRPLMAVVPADQMWVEANFKETQLKDMRLGQKATVTFDLYGDDIKFDGVVSGIDMGTGSAFSLLPAQNATGNWIKIVQRVPVRIRLNPEQVAKHPLRLGLSSNVTVDVKDTDGNVLRPVKPLKVLYKTDVLRYDETSLNQKIEQIIKANEQSRTSVVKK